MQKSKSKKLICQPEPNIGTLGPRCHNIQSSYICWSQYQIKDVGLGTTETTLPTEQ